MLELIFRFCVSVITTLSGAYMLFFTVPDVSEFDINGLRLTIISISIVAAGVYSWPWSADISSYIKQQKD